MVVAWVNFAILVVSAVLTLYFYIKSAGPAALEKKIGPSAYSKCTRYRIVASLFMTLAGANYVIYYFYPLPITLPRAFPWNWWVSGAIAVLIAVPSGYLFWQRARADNSIPTLVGKLYRSSNRIPRFRTAFE